MSGHDGRIGTGAFTRGPDPIQPFLREEEGLSRNHLQSVVAKPAGIALDLSAGAEDVAILLVDGSGATLLSLGPFTEEEVIAHWRSLALSSGATPMLKDANGRMEALAVQIGRIRIGTVRARRARVLARRRPRFLVRRKGARLPQRPLVYRECEMARGASA